MVNRIPCILVVGSPAGFDRIFEDLAATGRYLFDYAAHRSTDFFSLRPAPDAILLDIPAEESAARQALAWLEIVQARIPVVVILRQASMRLYLAVMNRGAFDCVASYTPIEEISRVLDTAIHRRCHAQEV